MPEPMPAGSGLPRPQQTQSPPMGVSPATGPTPNKGYEAAVIQGLGSMLPRLYELLPMAGATTDLGKSVLDIIKLIAKHSAPGQTNQAQQKNELDGMQRKNMQAMQTQKMLNQGQQGGGAPQGGQPPMGGGQPMPGMAA